MTKKKQTKKQSKPKQYRHISFKIDIDYLIRAMIKEKHITDPNEIKAFFDRNRQALPKFLRHQFELFLRDYKAEKGSCVLHNEDSHVDKKTRKRVLDDWHMHFLMLNNRDVKATLSAWRKRLKKYGLILTDEKRVEAQKKAGKKKVEQDIHKLDLEDFANAFAYQIHRTLQSIKDGKHAYDQDRIWTYNISDDEKRKYFAEAVAPKQIIKEDPNNKETSRLISYFIEKKDKAELIANFEPAENMYSDYIRHGMTVDEVKQRSKKIFGDYHATFWRMYHRGFENEEQEYTKKLMQQLPFRDRNFSLFMFYGNGGTGKTVVTDNLAYLLADSHEHKIHTVATSGKKKTFDLVSNYDNELVSVAHELTPSSIGVDEFENITEPHRYPSVNSRNHDKAYFAQSLLIAQPDTPAQFTYSMLFSDYMRNGRTVGRYSYENEIEKDDGTTEKLYFPPTYADFYRFFKNEDSTHWDHWNYKGANAFFVDVWQIIRRMRFTIGIEKIKDHEIYLHVRHVKENSQMREVKSFDDFKYNMNFDNFFEVVNTYYIDDFLNNSHVQVVLRKMLKDLKEKCNLKINSTLPKLLTDEQLHQLMADDGSNNLYDDIAEQNKKKEQEKDDKKEEKSTEKSDENTQNDAKMSDEELSKYVKENFGF